MEHFFLAGVEPAWLVAQGGLSAAPPDPILASLASYLLLKRADLDRMDNLTDRLADGYPDLPDAQAARSAYAAADNLPDEARGARPGP